MTFLTSKMKLNPLMAICSVGCDQAEIQRSPRGPARALLDCGSLLRELFGPEAGGHAGIGVARRAASRCRRVRLSALRRLSPRAWPNRPGGINRGNAWKCLAPPMKRWI